MCTRGLGIAKIPIMFLRNFTTIQKDHVKPIVTRGTFILCIDVTKKNRWNKYYLIKFLLFTPMSTKSPFSKTMLPPFAWIRSHMMGLRCHRLFPKKKVLAGQKQNESGNAHDMRTIQNNPVENAAGATSRDIMSVHVWHGKRCYARVPSTKRCRKMMCHE
jgi:hypothetical protein